MKLLFILFSTFLFSQASLVQSGPMLGYVEYREVMLWVQSVGTADVVIEYYLKDDPEQKFLTNMVRTERSSGYTAKLLADNVYPGNTYEYKVYINNIEQIFEFPLEFDVPAIWEYRTDPPAFSVAFGSCAFINDPPFDRPGRGYGGQYEIFNEIPKYDPDIFIWLGDNMYTRESDWYTETGFHYRYTHTRSLKEIQPILANSINLAIWDDHDYGPNNSDRSFRLKDEALKIFSMYWGNPKLGHDGELGAFTSYHYADIDFVLLDNRYHRTPNYYKTDEKTFLGEKQKQWLKDFLVSSSAPYKIVCLGGQFLNGAQKSGESYISDAPKERKELIDFIDEQKIKGVVFLTGDRHFTELSKYTTDSGIEIYDYTSSPLTSGAYTDGCSEDNPNRVEGTCVNVRNFGLIEVKGERKNRQLILKCIDHNGNEQWQHIIKR